MPRPRKARWALVPGLFALLACEPDEPDEPDEPRLPLPDVVATSKYIEYSSWADTASLCVDSRLAAADRFIEDTAAFLETTPPRPGSIRYVHVPISLWDPERTWACIPSAGGCFWSEGRLLDDRSVIYSPKVPSFHELVHAVEDYVIGLEHAVLREGLADYLGASYSTELILKEFPESLKAELERVRPEDYRTAAHFVGSLIERHGVPGFKGFAARVNKGDGLLAFSEAYAQEFAQDLDAALAEMALAPITGRRTLECDGEALSWTKPGELDVTLTGTCGDEHYYSPGGAPDTPGAFKQYVFDVTTSGLYDFTVSSTVPGTIYAALQNCERPVSSWTTLTSTVALDPGKHVLNVAFPRDPHGQAELMLRLILHSP